MMNRFFLAAALILSIPSMAEAEERSAGASPVPVVQVKPYEQHGLDRGRLQPATLPARVSDAAKTEGARRGITRQVPARATGLSPTAASGQKTYRGPARRTLIVNSGTRETQDLYEKGRKEPAGFVTTTREGRVENGEPIHVRQTTVQVDSSGKKRSFQVTATHNLATGTRTVTDGTRVRVRRAAASPTSTRPPESARGR